MILNPFILELKCLCLSIKFFKGIFLNAWFHERKIQQEWKCVFQSSWDQGTLRVSWRCHQVTRELSVTSAGARCSVRAKNQAAALWLRDEQALTHRSHSLHVIAIKIARCLSSGQGWQSPGMQITESDSSRGIGRDSSRNSSELHDPLAFFGYIEPALIKKDFGEINAPVVRGSEENCINGNKLKQQQTKDVVQFLFCFRQVLSLRPGWVCTVCKRARAGRTCFFCHCTSEGSARLFQRSGLLLQRAWGQEMPRHKNRLGGTRRPACGHHELARISEVDLSNVFHRHLAVFSQFLEIFFSFSFKKFTLTLWKKQVYLLSTLCFGDILSINLHRAGPVGPVFAGKDPEDTGLMGLPGIVCSVAWLLPPGSRRSSN